MDVFGKLQEAIQAIALYEIDKVKALYEEIAQDKQSAKEQHNAELEVSWARFDLYYVRGLVILSIFTPEADLIKAISVMR